MRGIISDKLKGFIEQANKAAQEAKQNSVKLSPSLVRANLDKLSVFIGDGPDLDYAQEIVLKCDQTINVNIPVRVYSPAPEQALPVVLHFHGGGHMCGSIALYDGVSRKIAKAGHCIVIAVEYRLAPEFPYPIGNDDCQYVLEHYKELLSQVKFNEQLIIAGDSGGGAICTTLASNNIGTNAVKIDKQILMYPSVDYTLSCASVEENGSGYLLEKEKVEWYFDHYFQHNESRKAVSPLFMAMDENMPETLIFTAGCDPLRDEGIAYKEVLIQAGVKVEHHAFEGMVHAYMLLDSLVEAQCQKTYQLIGDFIKQK
ncbi:MAG: alpha/beta hydrolase [Alteromonadaceae bacterium]|nr:alpha/beta hydrolase [Alteromonadaceae bacterium]